MGGLAGAVAEAGHMMIPQISVQLWVLICCLGTWLILFGGSYHALERILLVMVLFFSCVTMYIAFSMQATPYEVNVTQIYQGLSFEFPMEHLALALAVFGFTGISYGEIMAYTYWCLEKGYAQDNQGDIQKTKGWIKVMQTGRMAHGFIYNDWNTTFLFPGLWSSLSRPRTTRAFKKYVILGNSDHRLIAKYVCTCSWKLG
jgi:hypothetical protein